VDCGSRFKRSLVTSWYGGGWKRIENNGRFVFVVTFFRTRFRAEESGTRGFIHHDSNDVARRNANETEVMLMILQLDTEIIPNHYVVSLEFAHRTMYGVLIGS
jgi:hypothetical protein